MGHYAIMKSPGDHNISTVVQGKHSIIRYIKKLPEHMHYRSVVRDNKSGNIVCVAPSKSVEFQDDMYHNILAEEFIDGTMINLFWGGEDWEIATRSCVGGKNKFYKDVPTFRHMFLSALPTELDLDELPRLSENNRALVYSFVLQHKDNRIVSPITENRVYLVEIFEIENKETLASINNLPLRENKFAKHLIETHKFLRPSLYKLNCTKTDVRVLKDKYASEHTPYMVQGVVFKNLDLGLRAKYRNPNYETIRRLRGNQSSPLYRFLESNFNGTLTTYLKYYSEEKEAINNYKTIWWNYVKQLHKFYVMCYIKHIKTVKAYPYEYKIHMYKLHDLYKQTCKITCLKKVSEYMTALHPSQQMYVLNYTLNINLCSNSSNNNT